MLIFDNINFNVKRSNFMPYFIVIHDMKIYRRYKKDMVMCTEIQI